MKPVVWADEAWEDYLWWKTKDPRVHKRINRHHTIGQDQQRIDVKFFQCVGMCGGEVCDGPDGGDDSFGVTGFSSKALNKFPDFQGLKCSFDFAAVGR